MNNPYVIGYTFGFGDNSSKHFILSLDRETFHIIPEILAAPPAWTRPDNFRCPHCTLDPALTERCPIAVNIAQIAEEFKDLFSYEVVRVEVATEERDFSKVTSLQEGLSSLIGIIMVTSSCPVMEYLKPMVRFHLPFATLTESVYRHTSMYLVAQYFVSESGGKPDWEFRGLEQIYCDIRDLNSYFAQRLAEVARRDANINALVNLDCFANAMVDFRSLLEEIRPLFTAHLR